MFHEGNTPADCIFPFDYKNISSELKNLLYTSLTVIITFSFFQTVEAKKNGYFEGFIITNSDDTLYGMIKDRSPEPFVDLKSRISFKQKGKWRKKYEPGEIKAYSYNGILFESVAVREESRFLNFRYILDESAPKRFLKVISKDMYLIYYHWEYVHDDNFYLDFIPLFYKPGTSEMCRVRQGILGLKRKKLSEYFKDCKALCSAIENKEINDIRELYEYYINDCVRADL